MAMGTDRLLNANIYYFVLSGLMHGTQDWSVVKLRMKVPADTKNLFLPSVAITPEIAIDEPYEIGSSLVDREKTFVLSAFAKRNGQRDALGEYLKTYITQESKDFLDYNDGFPPTVGQSVLGRIDFNFLTMNPVVIENSPHLADKHRMDLRVSAEIIENPSQ